MTQEVLKLALEALSVLKPDNWVDKELQGRAWDAVNRMAQTQEPVAYLTKRKIGGTEGLLRADMVDRSAKNQETHDFIPLYTTPPQRKPLPPQSPCEMTQAEGKMFKLGWLECEAAHGITGEKK